MADTRSQMEKHLETIVNVFHQYSNRQGNRDTLNKKEFKQLVKKELQNFLKKENRDEKEINEILEDLDTNQDQTLDFNEFAILIARLINASHEEMHKNAHGEGHSHGPGLGGGCQGSGRGQAQGPGHSHGHGHGHSHGHSH
ncbi:protein S100-A9 [Dipodomys spectabilis]|uniref:protein S100-A9 n=1 Tax=Dipodomys spectabilis TaxID=105255 RepID=UPI001C549A8D|nr:protein S100-A9 [Dipodomys spectabilis]XP_042537764.1 protein S100-A9 [Dipodomys spectabilis]